jgi:hypothetical protein
MESRRVRLGDVIDDYCGRCRLLMNHGVVSIVGDDVKKVRCNTCMSEHTYRRGKLPASKRNATNKLFDEVLRGIAKPERPVPAALPARVEAATPEEPEADERGALPRPDDGVAPAEPDEKVAPPDPDGSEAGPAPGAGEPRPDPPSEPARMQRKLYTIRRAISDKSVDRGPKKS